MMRPERSPGTSALRRLRSLTWEPNGGFWPRRSRLERSREPNRRTIGARANRRPSPLCGAARATKSTGPETARPTGAADRVCSETYSEKQNFVLDFVFRRSVDGTTDEAAWTGGSRPFSRRQARFSGWGQAARRLRERRASGRIRARAIFSGFSKYAYENVQNTSE